MLDRDVVEVPRPAKADCQKKPAHAAEQDRPDIAQRREDWFEGQLDLDPTRLVFLGSLALGNEEQPIAYGDDPKRDMAGVLERIAPFRWRLVIPWPQSTSKLDVFELTPVAQRPSSE